MTNKETGYSVLVRVKNGERTIPALIESLLSQTCQPAEIIFVDNGSTDGTIAIIETLCSQAKVINYPDEEFNYSKALNLGMAYANFPFVLIISAHIRLLTNGLCSLALNHMGRKMSCAGVVLGRAAVAPPEEVEIKVESLAPLSVSNHAHLVALRAWKRLPFREDVTCCEDKFWGKSLAEKGWTFALISNVITYENPHVNHHKGYRDQMTMVRYLEEKENYIKGFRPLFFGLGCAILKLRLSVARIRFFCILGRITGKFSIFRIPGSKYF